jgi:hypothetical protein
MLLVWHGGKGTHYVRLLVYVIEINCFGELCRHYCLQLTAPTCEGERAGSEATADNSSTIPRLSTPLAPGSGQEGVCGFGGY